MTYLPNKINRINAIFMFAIFILLDISYKNSIFEMYRYMGFELVKGSIIKVVFTYLIAVVIIYITNFKKNSNFAQLITQLIALLLLFPTIIMFKNANTDPQILIAHLIFFFTTFYFLKHLKFRFKGKTLKNNQKLFFLFILVLVLIIPIFITFKANLNLNNFLLIDVYETRAIQKNLSNPFVGYFHPWLARIIIPVALIFSISKKAKGKSFFFIFLLLYLFLIGAHKSLLLGTILIIIFSYIPPKRISLYLNLGVFLILLLGVIYFDLFRNFYISNIITRRVFFIPALLDTYYFDFFKGKPLYWSYSFLSSFFEYPYQERPTSIIAYQYLGSSVMSSNNGIISDGYSNFGWGGIIINIIIVSGIFSFFNSLNINHKFTGVFILFFFSIVSSALPTIIMTHGGLVLIMISQFILKDTENTLNPNSNN